MIKFVKDEDATLMTNGEPLEITESQYEYAPKLYKWCMQCSKVTEHRRLPGGLKPGTVVLCNGQFHF